MILLVPMAGKSSRFPNMRPKWMLTHPNGRFMAIQSILGIRPKPSSIVFSYLQQHEDEYHFLKAFRTELIENGIDHFVMLPLPAPTKDVVETVYKTIHMAKIGRAHV